MEIKGIDVSHHNGVIDWDKVKAAGVQFALLRAGFGVESPSQIDKQFTRNYSECKRVGIPVGAYHYSYAKNVSGAEKELEFFLKIISGKQFEYPVFFDLEDKSLVDLSKKILTDNVIAFCGGLEKAGYYAALYSNPNWLYNYLEADRLTRFDLWLAEWRTKKTYTGAHGIWQYSDQGSVSGISGNVDLDVAYKNYPEIIKKSGLNGFGKYTVTAAKSGLNSADADTLAGKLNALDMTVVKKGE